MLQKPKGISHTIKPPISLSNSSYRLNNQHNLFVKTVGYDLHLKIRATLSPTSKIADIGTGTAVFLLSLARTFPPTTALVGYDISNAQYPPPESLPSNLTLKTNSILDPFPESERGSYDVVCVGLLVAVLNCRR